MPFSPTATATAIAKQIAAYMDAITGGTVKQDSITGGNNAPAALVDGLRAGFGYQGSDAQVMNPGAPFSITNGSYNPYGPSWAFNAPLSMTYTVDLQVSAFLTTAGIWACYFGIRCVNSNGTTDYTGSYPQYIHSAQNTHGRWTGKFPIPMVAGTNTLQVLALPDTGSTWQFTNADYRHFFVTG
jgi:hypothetical protein